MPDVGNPHLAPRVIGSGRVGALREAGSDMGVKAHVLREMQY